MMASRSVLVLMLSLMTISSSALASTGNDPVPALGFRVSQPHSRSPAAWFKKEKVRQNDLCICMIGSSPKKHQPWFRRGCSAWFTAQKCKARRRIEQDQSPGFSELLDERLRGAKVVLGYVGHWSSTEETLSWLEEELLPSATQYSIDLKIDNTACSGGDEPARLRTGINELLTKFTVKDLEIRVNQAVSTGLWDPFLPGINNFWITYRRKNGSGSLEFPSCRSFEDQPCWGWIQSEGSGVCEEVVKGKKTLRYLTCSQVEREFLMPAPILPATPEPARPQPPARYKQKLYRWTRTEWEKPNVQIVEESFQSHPRIRMGLKDNDLYDTGFYLAENATESEAEVIERRRRLYLDQLPARIELDAGDESAESKTVERSHYSLKDVVVKQRWPASTFTSYQVIIPDTEEEPMTWLGTFLTRAEAEALVSRMSANPLLELMR